MAIDPAPTPVDDARSTSRMVALAIAGLLCVAGDCDKESDHFDIGTAAVPDVTGPEISTLQPGADGVFNVTNGMFRVSDPAGSGGAPVSGVDPASISVAENGSTLPVTVDGAMVTYDVTGLGDGAFDFTFSASDRSGNGTTASVSYTIDTTPPEGGFETASPGDFEVDRSTFDLSLGFRLEDPNFSLGSVSIAMPVDGVCGNGDDEVAASVDQGGHVVNPTIPIPGGGSGTATFMLENPVAPGGAPLVERYCVNLRGEDAARDKLGAPNPNEFFGTLDPNPFAITFVSPGPAPGAIAGTVEIRDTDGTVGPLPDRQVDASPSSNADTRSDVTDAMGNYRIEGLDPGEYDVSVFMPGAGITCPDSAGVAVQSGMTTDVDIPCEVVPASIDVTGNLPAGAVPQGQAFEVPITEVGEQIGIATVTVNGMNFNDPQAGLRIDSPGTLWIDVESFGARVDYDVAAPWLTGLGGVSNLCRFVLLQNDAGGNAIATDAFADPNDMTRVPLADGVTEFGYGLEPENDGDCDGAFYRTEGLQLTLDPGF